MTTISKTSRDYYATCHTCSDVTVQAASFGGWGAVYYVWTELPAEEISFQLRGASMNMSMKEMGNDMFGESVPVVLGTGVQQTGLMTETMYLAVAKDELGCIGQAMFSIEKPKAEVLGPPSWGLHGNDSTGGELAGEGTPWLGTADSTDVVMKANGVPQLRLGANGVTSVEGQLRLANLQEAALDSTEPQFRLMVADENGVLATAGGDYFPFQPNPCKYALGGHVPYWDNGVNRIFVDDCYGQVNVGIGTEQPQSRLHVVGNTLNTGNIRSTTLSINTDDVLAQITVKGGISQSGKTLEVQKSDGSPTFRVYNDGTVTVGRIQQLGDVVTLQLGNSDHYIRSGYGQGLSLGTFEADDALVIEEGSGKVRIGGQTVINGPHTDSKLSVYGKIVARELFVHRDEGIWGWPDYVFAKDYQLRTIEEMENFIEVNSHLPGVPSAAEVNEEGIGLTTTTIALLEKIEEMSLYIIQLNKRLKELEKQVNESR